LLQQSELLKQPLEADTKGMRRLICVVLGSLLVAGCGGGVDSSLLATAVQRTEDAGGAEIAFQLEMDAPGLSQPIMMTGSGVEDAKSRRGRLSFDMSALASVPGAGALCRGGCDMTVVSDGNTVYMRSPMLAPGLGGREWMKLDIERFGSAMGIPMAGSGMGTQSASEQLRMLRAVSGDVSDEGREQVRGAETSHYSLKVDLRRTADLLPAAQREAARQGIEQLVELTGQSEIPMDVWIDDQQRVRRMEVDQRMKQAGIEVGVHMTMEYVRFGVPVDIDLPNEADVFDATGLALQQLNQAQP
jgi:hypothetical protein